MVSVVMALLTVMSGCGTTGKDITTKNIFNIDNNTGFITISPTLDTQSGDSPTTSNNTTPNDIPLDLTVPLTGGGTASSVLGAAARALTNSELQSTAEELNQEAQPQTEPVVEQPIEESSIIETHDLLWMSEHNRSFTWLNRTGLDYKAPLIFTFNNDCGTLTVSDLSNNLLQGDEARFFDGTHNKVEESNGDRASVFGPVGCQATQVTLSN